MNRSAVLTTLAFLVSCTASGATSVTWDETRKDTDTALIAAFQKSHPDISVTLLTWLTTNREAEGIVARSGLLPPQADVYRSQYLGALKGRNAETVLAQLPNSVIINNDVRQLDNLPEVLNVVNQQLNLAWTGNTPLTNAIQAASRSMAGLLKQSKIIGK